MKETICIYKEIEHSIIIAFNVEPGRKLSAAQIKTYVKKYIDESDNNIQKRIERMTKKKYLLNEKEYKTKALYYLNPEIEFQFEGMPLKPKVSLGETTTSERIKHTSDLDDAIKTWIYNFSEPCQDYLLEYAGQYSAVIAACENHVLFTDLSNHLPGVSSDICNRWSNYKEELAKLDELKETLLSSLEAGILKCFEGLKLFFVFDDDYPRDYECRKLSMISYNIVIGFETGQEGYDNYENAKFWLRNNIHTVERSDYILWGEYLRVPTKDRDQLKAGVARFLVFFEDLEASDFYKIGRDIPAKVNSLKQERESIIRELDRILKYTSLPGSCEYLS